MRRMAAVFPKRESITDHPGLTPIIAKAEHDCRQGIVFGLLISDENLSGKRREKKYGIMQGRMGQHLSQG